MENSLFNHQEDIGSHNLNLKRFRSYGSTGDIYQSSRNVPILPRYRSPPPYDPQRYSQEYMDSEYGPHHQAMIFPYCGCYGGVNTLPVAKVTPVTRIVRYQHRHSSANQARKTSWSSCRCNNAEMMVPYRQPMSKHSPVHEETLPITNKIKSSNLLKSVTYKEMKSVKPYAQDKGIQCSTKNHEVADVAPELDDETQKAAEKKLSSSSAPQLPVVAVSGRKPMRSLSCTRGPTNVSAAAISNPVKVVRLIDEKYSTLPSKTNLLNKSSTVKTYMSSKNLDKNKSFTNICYETSTEIPDCPTEDYDDNDTTVSDEIYEKPLEIKKLLIPSNLSTIYSVSGALAAYDYQDADGRIVLDEYKQKDGQTLGLFRDENNQECFNIDQNFAFQNFLEPEKMKNILNKCFTAPQTNAVFGGSNPEIRKSLDNDKQSTLSKYWTMDRSLQRRLQKTNYQHIKRLCRDRGKLFEDVDFPPVTKSIYKHRKMSTQSITWLRPHEICHRPKFIAEGATRFDVEQGDHGDPWLLAAISSLTLTPRFLDRVVPPDQSFDQNYCGIFRFRFWHFGNWVEVLIDDYLPTYKGRLTHMHSTDPSEFWAALLEKAYAKFYGCYESLHSGFTTRAMQDLTGGIVQSFSLNAQDKLLTYQVLSSAVPRSTLLVASINVEKHDSKRQLRLKNGLITRHAYCVTGLARVRGHLGDTHLVRLRNPWGKGEWNGPWSDRSWEWDSLSDRDKELLSVRVRNEGEFWMSFEDFAKHFSHLDLVHIGPDDWMSEASLQSKKPWRAVLARRRWRSGYNAGGSPNYMETTSMNPQFHIQIPRSISGSSPTGVGGNGSSPKCHVVVSVTQQYETNSELERAKKRMLQRKKRKLHHIGFAVYEVPPLMTRLTPLYVAEHAPLDVTNHSVAREVVTFFTLPPGDYIVVPQTNVPNCDGKFLLRILTDELTNIWEVNEDNVLLRNVLSEFEESFKYIDNRVLLNKLASKYPAEIDAVELHKILKNHWRSYALERPSLEMCKSLVMLRDYNISGKLSLMEIPVVLHMLQFWKTAFSKYSLGSSCPLRVSSFNLRMILWEAGITVSNKVLECLVLRFAKFAVMNSEAFFLVMVRLHLAHERYHSIDTKLKGNPLSLEEMILMTIYS